MNPLVLENARLRDRIEQLEEELAFERALNRDSSVAASFAQAFGLVRRHAFVLARLYASKGAPVTAASLEHAMPSHWSDDRDPQLNISVAICQMRKKLGALSIRTHTGFGYALSPELLKACRQTVEGSQHLSSDGEASNAKQRATEPKVAA